MSEESYLKRIRENMKETCREFDSPEHHRNVRENMRKMYGEI